MVNSVPGGLLDSIVRELGKSEYIRFKNHVRGNVFTIARQRREREQGQKDKAE